MHKQSYCYYKAAVLSCPCYNMNGKHVGDVMDWELNLKYGLQNKKECLQYD